MMNNTNSSTVCSLCDRPAHPAEHLIAGLTFDPADLVCAECAESLAD